MLREFQVRRHLGEEKLCIAIDARRVQYETRGFKTQQRRLRLRRLPKPIVKILNKLIYETSNFRLPEAQINRTLISETPVYLKMKDVFEHREKLQRSQTYEEIARAIDENGVFKHKKYLVRSKGEIEDCIKECFLDILLSMDEFGYLADKETAFATGGLGSAFIDSDGTILKSIGATHRFAAAQVVGLEDPFPLRILGAHADWLYEHDINGTGDLAKLSAQIQKAEQDNR